MTLDLGGPGVACSAMRVRRFEAGELFGDERARTESHLVACARCQTTQRELVRERALLARDLPFEAMAAGVAERLAAQRPRRRSPRAFALALAAGLAAAVAVPALLRKPADERGYRLKGGAALTLYARDGAAARPLSPTDRVPANATLRIGLSPDGHKFAAVALVDADGAAILYTGPAATGVLPGAFEWTGTGEGTLLGVLDDEPIDAAALASRLSRDGPRGAAPNGRAEVVVRTLQRGAP